MSEAANDGGPIFDLTESVPELGAVRDYLEAERWSDAMHLVQALGEKDEGQLAVVSQAISGVPDVEQHLAEIIRDAPENLLARALRANRLVTMAWEGDAGDSASEESDDQYDMSLGHLREAELELIELCAVAPRMALPWSLRLMTARGLGMGVSEARRRYERLAQGCPHHFSGQQHMLVKLSPLWGGSSEALFAFARECVAVAPPGAASNAILAAAHFEVALAMPPSDRAAYFTDPEIRTDIVTGAARSVLDPAFGPNLHEISLHSLFAILWSFAGEHAEASVHFNKLGASASSLWFGRFMHPVEFYHQQRAAAFELGADR